MKNIVGSAVLSIIIFVPTAQATPVNCPSIEVIQTHQFKFTSNTFGWLAVQKNQTYDSQEPWDFVAGYVQSENKKDAEEKMLTEIGGLKHTVGPVGKELSVCFYSNPTTKLRGIAITPPTTSPEIIWFSLNIYTSE